MSYQFSHDVPIYLQIMEIFRDQILSGQLVRGDQLPSVREVAMNYGVNPNTVQKAFLEMDRMELTRSERTSGRFVVASDVLLKKLRTEESHTAIEVFIQRMKTLGIECAEIIEIIKERWNDN